MRRLLAGGWSVSTVSDTVLRFASPPVCTRVPNTGPVVANTGPVVANARSTYREA